MKSCRKNLRRLRGAFSLLEIIVVIAMIALLAGLTVSNIGGMFSSGQERTAKLFVGTSMASPLMAYRMDMGSYPTTEEGLMALIKAPESAGAMWKGPYVNLKELPKDPWGMAYQYRCPGVHNPTEYEICSFCP
ncbi:MAG: type II secretion system protein GspG, partial [Opitutales bacterium]|nr:type II secretion system protein GspG [Opitutales bacterium]